jgi:L-alanine-DL-glutamate epimerase-like enolase superfamily enzyme
MKISSVVVSHHRLPLDPAFHPTWDSRPRTFFDIAVVRVTTDEGLMGVGAGDAMPGFAGHEDLFLGQHRLALERHQRVLENLNFHYGRCWPLDLALWDLAGKIAGQPVWRLLGGLCDRVATYASAGARREPAEAADLAEHVLERGFRAMKVRFWRADWHADLAAVEAIRARVGDRLILMVDCNQGWRMPQDTTAPCTLKEALSVARALEGLDVYWMEEPLHRGDHEGLAALRRTSTIRIAGGEGDRERHELRDLIDRGCLDVVQPDAAWSGGISGVRRVAVMAAEHGIAFSPHTWGTGVGLLANAHLATGLGGCPYLEFPYDPPTWTGERRDFMLQSPLDITSDGMLVLDETAGLGFTLDVERLAATKQ